MFELAGFYRNKTMDDITPNGWFSKGKSRLSKKSRLVKYYDLAKYHAWHSTTVVEWNVRIVFVATVPKFSRIWILQTAFTLQHCKRNMKTPQDL